MSELHRIDEGGIALFLVLWVLTLLSVIVGEFCYAMRSEVNITRNFMVAAQARYFAEAGLNMAISKLISPSTAAEISSGRKGGDQNGEQPILWRVNADIPAVPFANGRFKVKLENESGKININRADARMLRMILNSFDLLQEERNEIVDAILDWRDADNLHRLNGAEDDYYESLPTPYEARDDDFQSVEELLLVRGITEDLYHGGLKGILTIYGEDNTQQGPYRINLNAAGHQVLKTLPMMTDELVNAIQEYRREHDYHSTRDLAATVGPDVYAAIRPFVSFDTGPYYAIHSMGMVEEGSIRRRLTAILKVDPKLNSGYRILKMTVGTR